MLCAPRGIGWKCKAHLNFRRVDRLWRALSLYARACFDSRRSAARSSFRPIGVRLCLTVHRQCQSLDEQRANAAHIVNPLDSQRRGCGPYDINHQPRRTVRSAWKQSQSNAFDLRCCSLVLVRVEVAKRGRELEECGWISKSGGYGRKICHGEVLSKTRESRRVEPMRLFVIVRIRLDESDCSFECGVVRRERARGGASQYSARCAGAAHDG